MPRVLSHVLIAVLGLPAIALAQASPALPTAAMSVAYMSPQRAFDQSTHGRAARAELASLEAEIAQGVEARSTELQGLRDALEQETALLSASARVSRQQEVERFEVDLQRFVEDMQARYLGVQRELENAFLTHLSPAVEAVAQGRGLSLVFNLDAGVFVWSDPTLDITDAVVEQLNQSQP